MAIDTGSQIRTASIYAAVVAVLAVAIASAAAAWALIGGNAECADAAFAVCSDPERLVLAIAPPAVLLLGGLAAFVKTYRVWRSGGSWPAWQGAGWFLLVFMVIYLGISGQALTTA